MHHQSLQIKLKKRMEDVIPESESLLLPLNLNARGGGGGGGGGGAKGEEGHHEANGFNNEGKEVDKEQASSMNGDEGKDEEKGSGGGGIITHLISIVSPRSTPKEGEAAKRKVDFEVDDIGNGGFSSKSEQDGGSGGAGCENSNGGVFSNLISNFFNQSDGGGGGNDEVEKEAEKVMKDIGNKRMKVEEEKEGSEGGIIDHIVSHLPTSLPDNAAPSTDEASILITSVVRD